MDMANDASAANALLRMTLQNCGTNNPQILGTSIVLAYQKDFHADSTGQLRLSAIWRHNGDTVILLFVMLQKNRKFIGCFTPQTR